MRLVLVLALLPLAGCTIEAATGCDFRNGSVNGPEDRCQERTGVQSAGFDEFCEGLGGEAVDGGCPTDGIVGGCEQAGSNASGGVTDWYYAPETVESVQAHCDDDGATFVEG